ncbi:MAG TPA: hypothetical protein PLF22_02345 [Pseudomonadales bacterium]|nr:hypothetical protein [Pseudomonadales bacterium]
MGSAITLRVDDVVLRASSSLIEDTDDDNDGVLDVNDKFPLNAAASIDGDNDGLPDSWNASNPYGCAANAPTCNGLTLDPQIPQTITITQWPPGSAVYGSSFNVAATASSGLPVSIGVSGGCSVAENVVTMTSGTNSCTINFSQAGNASFNPVTASSTTSATKASQSITVTQPAPASAVLGSKFSVAATASSGFVVAITASGGCSASGNTITMTSGTTICTVNYNQEGDGNYNSAATVFSTTAASSVWPLDGAYKGSSIRESASMQ